MRARHDCRSFQNKRKIILFNPRKGANRNHNRTDKWGGFKSRDSKIILKKNMENIYLLVAFFVCHWAADYTHLSTSWMLNAKRLGTPLHPILAHAAVHAVLMSFVALCFLIPIAIVAKLFLFQLSTHFIIDVWKGRASARIPSLQNPANKYHWYMFGFDQLLHALAIIAMFNFTK